MIVTIVAMAREESVEPNNWSRDDRNIWDTPDKAEIVVPVR
jgi:hypothetical protein